MKLYIPNRFIKYEFESIFEQGKFIECSEDYFNETVVKYRNQFDIKYYGTYQEFTDINTGSRIRRYYS